MLGRYTELSKLDWEDINDEMNRNDKLPLSVHCPLNWPGAKRQVMCDSAFNAWVMDSPALNTSQAYDQNVRDNQRWEILNWFFDEHPAIMDCNLVRLKRKIGGLPIIQMEATRWNFIYTADYCVDPAGRLHVRMTVANDSVKKQKAHLWLRPANPLEMPQASEYHYWPFIWNNTRVWPDDSYSVDLKSGAMYFHGKPCGSFQAEGMEAVWEENIDFSDIDFNYCRMNTATPQYARPDFQIKKMNNLLHFTAELESLEKRSVEVVYDCQSMSVPLVSGEWSSYDEAEAAAVKLWREIEAGKGQIKMDRAVENDVIEATTLSSLQLLLEEGKDFRPCQGGMTERYFVWVWEAMCSLRPMLRLGYFKEVKKVIDFIFSLQDGGCPPEGKFTTVEGAVGTTGPKWANATGSALMLAADYLDYSGDKNFINEYLDKMLRAGRWIIGEIRATRIPGNPTYGVFPECCASDGDYGQVIFTDCWTLGGLQRLRDILKLIGHPEYEEFAEECRQYRHDLHAVMDSVTEPNGFIHRTYGESGKVCHEFRYTDTCLDCCLAEADEATSPRMVKYLDWLEANAFVDLFCSIVTYNIYYIGNNEFAAMRMWLERHEWKKAWIAAKVFRRYAMTPDLYLTQERYALNESAFTAWQPNASNNGRFIELQFNRMCLDLPEQLVLYGGFSPRELSKCPGFSQIHTKFGLTSLSIDDKRQVTMITERPIPVGLMVVTPWKSIRVEEDTCKLEI